VANKSFFVFSNLQTAHVRFELEDFFELLVIFNHDNVGLAVFSNILASIRAAMG